MLTVDGLQVAYARVHALQGVSIRVSSGEIVAVIGPNGAGKSTTLNAIFGLAPVRAGAIDFEGTSLVGQAPDRVARRGIALIPEGRHIFGTLTVAENLQVGATARADRAGLAHDREAILDRFPALRRLLRRSAGKLSGGEQQQLAIARALISRPRLLMLDEPSLGLAPKIVELVFETIASLRDDGVTVLLVEQNAVRASELADRTYVLRNGRVGMHGTRDEMRQIDIASAYLGESAA